MKTKRSYIREILDAINDETISFAGGLPNESLFPMKEIKKASNKVFENSSCLQYSTSQGIESLRQKIADFYTYKLGFKTSKQEILLTNGSQQSFDLIAKLLSFDDIIIETPSYIGAIKSFEVLNKNLIPFKKINDLNHKLTRDSCLYLISDFQNPSSNSYSKKQRKELSEILKQNKSILIEDGAYMFLGFNNKFRKPISVLYENSFHLGSFSKILAPGLRLGWIRTNKKNISSLLPIKEALDLHTPTLNQMIVDEYLNNNDIFKHIKKMNLEYEKKMNFMADSFEKYLPEFIFKRPNGGMFIYGMFEIDTMKFAKEVLKENIAFVPAEVFYINKKSKEARFNFTNPSFNEIDKGVKMLSKIYKKRKNSFYN